LTDVAKRLIASETVFVCVASCCQRDASFELLIKLFEQSIIRQAPSTTFRADDKIGSCNCRPYLKKTKAICNRTEVFNFTFELIVAGILANSFDMA